MIDPTDTLLDLRTARSPRPDTRPLLVLVTGSREWRGEWSTIVRAIKGLPAPLRVHTLMHGNARGVDRFAAALAGKLSMSITAFPVTDADWRRYGKSAGHRRNVAMLARRPDVVLAFWTPPSPGTRGTFQAALRAMKTPEGPERVTVYLT